MPRMRRLPLSAALGLVLAVFSLLSWPMALGIPLGLALAGLGVLQVLRWRSPRDVARDMLEVASSVGEVTGTRIVLMGHSHHGSLERRGEVIYGNSGSWLDGSHLVARRRRHGGDLLEVEPRRWRNGGITVLESMSVDDEIEHGTPDTTARATEPVMC